MYILVIINEDKIWGLIKQLLFPNFIFFYFGCRLISLTSISGFTQTFIFLLFFLEKKKKRKMTTKFTTE
jgi:hypothetical protein